MNPTFCLPKARLYSTFQDGRKFTFLLNPEMGFWYIPAKDELFLIQKLLANKHSFSKNSFDRIGKREKDLLVKLFKSGLLSINGQFYFTPVDVKEEEDVSPLIVILNLTKGCNLGCTYCYAHATFKGQGIEYSVEDLLGYIYTLRRAFPLKPIKIIFHGGEPLTKIGRIKEIIESFEGMTNILYSIQTNGTLLTVPIIRYLKSKNISIGVSLDGSTIYSNRNRPFLTGGSSLPSVLKSLRRLSEEKCHFGVLCVITRENQNFLYDTIKDLALYGVRKFVFNTLLNTGKAKIQEEEIDFETLADTYVQIACYINDYNKEASPEDFITERSISTIIASITLHISNVCYCTPCAAGKSTVAIDTNGELYACDCLVGEKEFTMGTLKGEYKIPSIHAFPKLAERKNETIQHCKTCIWRSLCIYKCAADTYFLYGDLYHPHSYCRFSQIILPRFMELLDSHRIEACLFPMC